MINSGREWDWMDNRVEAVIDDNASVISGSISIED